MDALPGADGAVSAAMHFAPVPALGPAVASRILAVGPLEIDLVSRTATRDGRVLRLHPKQFLLLVYLAMHAGRVVSREAIARDVWSDEMATWTNIITVIISGLRKELDPEGIPPLLHTLRGRGYRLG